MIYSEKRWYNKKELNYYDHYSRTTYLDIKKHHDCTEKLKIYSVILAVKQAKIEAFTLKG